ncbi:MAG: cytochrome c oxidase subunit II, partial [Acidobacteria bacterium]|nr:cytochrome c oxidase subunit II [Acidobacteriota bacterium]
MGRLLGALIWIITIVSVWLFANARWWFPRGITEHAPAYDQQFMLTIVIVGIAFVTAQLALGFAVWRYSSRGDRAERAVYTHGNNRLEMIWTGITAVIFIGVALLGQRVWARLHFYQAPPGSAQVHVVAQQFQWNFHYPGADGQFGHTDPKLIKDSELNFVGLDDKDPAARDDQVVTTLVIPVNRQDLVPGMNITVHYTPVQTGKFELACAELCGQLHYKMKSYLVVVTQQEYDDLLKMPQAQFQWNFHYPGADGLFGHTDPKLIKDSELNFVGLDDKDPAARDDQVVTTLVIPVNR